MGGGETAAAPHAHQATGMIQHQKGPFPADELFEVVDDQGIGDQQRQNHRQEEEPAASAPFPEQEGCDDGEGWTKQVVATGERHQPIKDRVGQ